MFRFMRSLIMKPESTIETIALSQEVTNYLNEKYGHYYDGGLQFGVQMFGTLGKISWFTNYKNLAIIEELNQQLREDQKFEALNRKIGELAIAGSSKDELFRMY